MPPQLGVSAAQLASRRAQVAQLLPDLGTILLPNYVSDGAGGGSLSYPTSPTGGTVACRFDPYMPKRQIETEPGKEAIEVAFYVTMPFDAPLAIDRRITHNGFTYEIRILTDDHDWGVCQRVFVARID